MPISEDDKQSLDLFFSDPQEWARRYPERASRLRQELGEQQRVAAGRVETPSRSEIVRELNRQLREKGLKDVSAHGHRGTAWGWIGIDPKHHPGQSYRSFTFEEREGIGEIYGRDPGMTNSVSDEMDAWALKLGMIGSEEYHESPWRTLVRENRD